MALKIAHQDYHYHLQRSLDLIGGLCCNRHPKQRVPLLGKARLGWFAFLALYPAHQILQRMKAKEMVVLVAKILSVHLETLSSSAVWKRSLDWNQFPEKKTGILSDFSNNFTILFLIAASSLIRSFSIDHGDGTFKMNSRFCLQTFSSSLQFAEKVKCRLISLELISWRPHSS